MKLKNMVIFAVMLVSIFALSSIASALTISEVKVDGDALRQGDNFIEKNDEYEVRVILNTVANESYADVQVSAYLRGDDNDDEISDTTDAFDVEGATQYVKKLTLKLPVRMEQDSYTLFVRVENRHGEIEERTIYNLKVRSAKHVVTTSDVILSPSNGVKAGRALLATVRVQNRGLNDEDDVKVTFAIPELGVSAADYVDELERDGDDKDSRSTEELYLRIPECAKAGVYEGIVEISYRDGDFVERKKVNVEVLADEACEVPSGAQEAKITINVASDTMDVTRGAGGVAYPITITNTGSSKTFVLSVVGGDWGTFRVSPTNVVTVGNGETKTAYVYASANANAPAGMQVFSLDIKSDDKSLKQIALKANVVGGTAVTGINLRKALEYGLIALVVILVILGLIIAFRKLRNNDDEGKEEGQSYY